jgi:NADH dehydrogenase FAD-containing subunit
MTYPSTWMASTDPEIESGEASFTVEGVKYTMRLESFEDFQKITRMLEDAFQQGKQFAADAISSHIYRALDNAKVHHGIRD